MDYKTALTYQSREQVWAALQEKLHQIPSRNNLVCAGDFNCSLAYHPPWVGGSTFPWKGQQTLGSQHPDHERLQQILRVHGLTAVNTWNQSGATYYHGSHASRIDHILLRTVACDGSSKAVLYLEDADFVPHNQSHHIPIQCSVPAKHMSYQTFDSKTACTHAQRTRCRQESLQETPNWQLLRQQVVDALQSDHQAFSADEVVTRIHDTVSHEFHQLFRVKIPI